MERILQNDAKQTVIHAVKNNLYAFFKHIHRISLLKSILIPDYMPGRHPFHIPGSMLSSAHIILQMKQRRLSMNCCNHFNAKGLTPSAGGWRPNSILKTGKEYSPMLIS